jgi:lysophospholipase L1-like esterase
MYLALGDSYTIGQSVAVEERFPEHLVDSLQHRGINIARPEIIARTGWTTDELQRAISEKDPQGPYDLVTVLIGVNNQYRGYDINTYRAEFVSLLNQAIAFAGNEKDHVVVLSIPDWGVTPFASGQDRERIAAEIDAFNAINQQESESAGVPYVNITTISRLTSSDSELVAGDGLHPSGKMYAEWVKKILPVVENFFE